MARPKTAREVEREIRLLLDMPGEDSEVRARFEELAHEEAFPGFVWLWGPPLYRRNARLFRPFLLSRMSWSWAVAWKGEPGRALDAWLAEADRLDDVELFRQLYSWKHWRDFDAWREDLVRRFQAAPTPAARATVLRKLDGSGLDLTQDAAVALYHRDPAASRPFLRNHLPWRRGLWEELLQLARARGDEDFADEIYQRLVEPGRWKADVRDLCARVADPAALGAALKRHHPTGSLWDFNIGKVFAEILRLRGRDALPYVLRHLRDARQLLWIGRQNQELLELARQNGWFDLWAQALRTLATPDVYNTEVRRLAEGESGLPLEEEIRRLLALAGLDRDARTTLLGTGQPLYDPAATALYRRHPEMVRGPFKRQLHLPTRGGAWRLLEAAIAAGDEELVDFLASRLATRWEWDWKTQAVKPVQSAEKLADHYAALKEADPEAFARRAGRALGQIPAFAILGYDKLLQGNRLARLLFERSAESFLADPAALEDLLEAPEIHVQALAYRALGTDDPRARALAARRLDLLLATLLRPLRRGTRQLAFRALENAAAESPEVAGRVLARGREALDLPDRGYPKESLVGLLGKILHRWPELRGPRERPVVWGAAA